MPDKREEGNGMNPESSAVQKHLELVQAVIQRMAENSRSCKLWCATLVSATLVLVARTGEPRHALVALAPAVLLLVLDAYYLALERGFRRSYGDFVDKLHRGRANLSDLYTLAPTGSIWRGVAWALFRSCSVLPFYFVVIATIVLAWQLIL